MRENSYFNLHESYNNSLRTFSDLIACHSQPLGPSKVRVIHIAEELIYQKYRLRPDRIIKVPQIM